MLRQFRSVLSAGIALILAAESSVQPAFAEGDQAIGTVSFSNVNTSLTIGKVPDYTAYIEGDTLLHASIINEGWSCIKDSSIHAAKTEGLPIPDEPTGVPYVYVLALSADSGWYFPEDISVYYESNLMDSSEYTAVVLNEGQNLVLYCDFIPWVTPMAPNPEQLTAVEIMGAILDYNAGDAPLFQAYSEEPEKYALYYERWVDDSNTERFITSNEAFNKQMMLTDENRLREFTANGQYHYDLCITAKYGYIFADDVILLLNGTPYPVYTHTLDTIVVNDVRTLIVPEVKTDTSVSASQTTITTNPTTSQSFVSSTSASAAKTTVKSQSTTSGTSTVSTKQSTTEISVPTAAFDPDILYGDVNQDGRISVSDVVLLLRYLSENNDFEIKEAGLSAADINLDGFLDMSDIALLVRLVKEASATQQAIIPPIYYDENADDSEFEKLDFSDYIWIADQEGNSKAFTEHPVEGLTVSGEENVLSYDGQLQFTELTDDETLEMCEFAEKAYCTMVDGWHVDAGLKPDEHLPGNYTCSYDLSTLGIPETMYDQVAMLRLADDGTVQRYATERDGSVLTWESDQNSIVITVLIWSAGITFAVTVPFSGVLWWNEYQEEVKARGGCTGTLQTPKCTIYYEDTEDAAIKEKRQKRMREIEQAAEQNAKNEINPNDFAGLRNAQIEELERLIAVRKQEILDADEKYQELLAVENGHPADVVLLARQYEIAEDYLHYQEKCPRLGYAPDILFLPVIGSVNNVGEAKLTMIQQKYILLKRVNPDTGKHVSKDLSFWDLYPDSKSQRDTDAYLTTLTHETFHLVQAKKYLPQNVANTKFMEMSAFAVEFHSVKYYMDDDLKYINSHVDDNGQDYETYAIPMDECSWYLTEENSNLQTKAGYAMGRFWNFIENSSYVQKLTAGKTDKPKITGWDMILGYAKYGKISVLINNQFGFNKAIMKGDNPNRILDFMWRKYQESLKSDSLAKGSSDFAALIKKYQFSAERTKQKSIVPEKDLACTLVSFEGAKDREWSVIFERDPDFGELQRAFQFMIPNEINMQKNKTPLNPRQETKNGFAVTRRISPRENEHFLCFRELQGSGAKGSSAYTIHYIPAPDTPNVTVDEQNEKVKLKLKTGPSTEGSAGMTDGFLVVFTVNGKEVLSYPVSFDSWSQEIEIPFSDLHLSMKQENKLSITVCEWIDSGTNAGGLSCPEFRLAESLPFEKTIGKAEFMEVDMEFLVEGQCGSVGFTKFEKHNAHFKLEKNGEFTWSIPDVGDPDSGYFIAGFTVSGKVVQTDADFDPTDWTAPITSCSPGSFSAHYIYKDTYPFLYDPETGKEYKVEKVEEKVVSGEFEGDIIGSLKFRFDENESEEVNKYSIRLKLSPNLLSRETITETPGETTSEEITYKENSVTFNGPMSLAAKDKPGLDF